jgi:uncharacterized flavoprotein (TIGR03862 family)
VSASEVAIVGAGPAGLMAAETIAAAGVRVTVYDRMPSAARKFLMAGRGGLNLTHSEALDVFLARYGAAEPRLRAAIEAFPPDALRAWSEQLGQPTFVGSSGRVFPQAFKASPLLRAWLRRLDARGVRFALRHNWTGWDASGALRFATPEGERLVRPDATLLALGGASWPRLGADGTWTSLLADKGIAIAPLKPANCGFLVAWSDVFRSRFEGQPLKGVQLRHGERSVRGEAVVTRHGLEGGGIYALSASLRDAIAENGETILQIGLRPDLPAADLVTRLSLPRGKQSVSTFLRKAAGLSPVGIGLLQEAAARMGTPLAAMPAGTLAALIGGVPVVLTGPASIDRAISTAGGLAFDEIDDRFMLRRWPGLFVAGEMMDWEAPTGGYLLQACFAAGVAAGKGVLEFLQR